MGLVTNGFEAAGMMEWEKQSQHETQQAQQQIEQQSQNGVVGGGGLYVKVMTDEQMELLRRQISVYATICEQLVEMHKAITAQQDLTGMRLGNFYCDPLISAGHKITARQRWTPTPVQLQILERIFDQGNGTPSKQKIKEITSELTQHGQISETNVYNWFQNRRARSKRKQSVVVPNNGESEVETDVESPKDKKTKPESIQTHENMYFPSPEVSAEMHCLDVQSNKGEPAFPSDRGLRSGLEQLIGKMEVPGSFSPCRLGEGYDMVG